MDWLERMNKALDYIEENLDGVIDYSEAAAIACCSTYHFQRMFAFATDMTLGEYIRLRRMSEAAFELQKHAKVIDVAIKYGYNSPTAFTRAFIGVHGTAPSMVREKGVMLKSIPRLVFQMSIKGGKAMNYKITEKPAMRFIGRKETISTLDGQNFIRIPKFWEEIMKEDTFERICKLSSGDPSGVLGICANGKKDQFDYYIASSSAAEVPTDMTELKVPAGMWVVFTCVGPLPVAMQDVWKQIYTEWFPSSGYEHTGGAELEWYSDEDCDSPDYVSEIWIPVVKK